MGTRFTEPTSWPDAWPALVVCPRCAARAVVSSTDPGRTLRLTCTACGLAREGGHIGSTRGVVKMTEAGEERAYDLWLRSTCCGGRLLWAMNEGHLDYLEAFIAADLRERNPEHKSFGLSWRLPTWMKEARHRDEILQHIARLRASLED